jgi:phage-related protein (TIGR01555 family)
MGNVFAFARDSLTSLVSRMGTERDKASTVFYTNPVMTTEQLIASYRGSWLPRKIVDIPALDSCRKWRDWQADADVIELIEAEEKRLNVKGKVLEASKKARLFGGAALYIGTADSDTSKPLEVERIGKGGLKYLTVLTCLNLTAGEIDRDPASEWYGRARYYSLSTNDGRQLTIHPSRLVLFEGAMTPDVDLNWSVNQGWGESVLTATLDAIKNADSTAGNIASLVFEAKVDIIRIPNFMASLADAGYKNKIIERYTLANMSKGINGTLMLDKEEEYETKSASLAGLTDILMAFMQIVSGAADIPVTRLLGQSPAGMNSTGTSDMKNYHDRVQSIQELELTPAMSRLDECIIRTSTGSRDPEIYYEWAPLEQMSEKERADIFKIKADAARVIVGSSAGQEIITREAVSDALINTLTEDGSLPGLEGFVDEYGKLSEQEPSLEEQTAALALQQAAQARKPQPGGKDQPTKDAALNQMEIIKGALDAGKTFDEALALVDQASFVIRMAERLGADTLVDLMQSRTVKDTAPRTLYVSRKVINGADIIAWAKGQGFTSTLPAEDLHVTITFSRTPVDWMQMGSTWEDEVKVPRGGARLIEVFGEGAVVLLFNSNMLQWRHQEMVDKGASWDHPEYQPHITIAYEGAPADISKIEPYQGEIILGPEIFAEVNEDWKSEVQEA